MSGKSMYKTKLCVSYRRGRCSRPNCSFAHGNAELRRHMGSSHSGRRNNQGIDLRDKLARRLSLERKVSPGRDARGRQAFGGYDGSRLLEKRRDREHREDQKLKDQSDSAGNVRITKSIEGQVTNGEDSSKNGLNEQLKEVQLDINVLGNRKLQIGACIEEKVQEADSLISRIQELEAQLDREKEERKRITSSIKKFVKEYSRFSRAQEELKRSQARLQKLGNQLGADVTRAEGNDGDLNINIVSDEENTGFRPNNPQNSQNEVQNRSSASKKRRLVDQDAFEESIADAMLRGGGEAKLETVKRRKPSHWNSSPFTSDFEKEAVEANDEPSAKEEMRKRRKFCASPSVDKLKGSGSVFAMPSTSIAAHAVDEVAEIEEEKIEVVETIAMEAEGGATLEAKGLPFSIPPPPPRIFRNSYSQYEGEDEKVDVDGVEETIGPEIV